MSKRCPKCGNRLDEKAKFCDVCGTKLSGISNSGSAPETKKRQDRFLEERMQEAETVIEPAYMSERSGGSAENDAATFADLVKKALEITGYSGQKDNARLLSVIRDLGTEHEVEYKFLDRNADDALWLLCGEAISCDESRIGVVRGKVSQYIRQENMLAEEWADAISGELVAGFFAYGHKTSVSAADAALGIRRPPRDEWIAKSTWVTDDDYDANGSYWHSDYVDGYSGPKPAPQRSKKLLFLLIPLVVVVIGGVFWMVAGNHGGESAEDSAGETSATVAAGGDVDAAFDGEVAGGEIAPDGEGSFQGHRYRIYNDPLTWSEAEEKCESMGGHLATITSEGERDFIEALIEQTGTKDNYWLGATDRAGEGKWEWVTGEPWDRKIAKWRKIDKQPNNGNGDIDQDYLQIDHCQSVDSDRRMHWSDNGNDGQRTEDAPKSVKESLEYTGYICEWDD